MCTAGYGSATVMPQKPPRSFFGAPAGALPGALTPERVAEQAAMLANRVKKTFRHLRRRFERRQIGAFRLYDRDIPEVRAVVDWYEGHLVVAEYARRQTEDIPDYLEQLAGACARALEVPPDQVHLKRRRTRPAEGERYPAIARSATSPRLSVREGDLSFWVNLDEHVDTGLFLDHRETRLLVRNEAAGRRFLNLFGYTGSFTCHAAAGGAAGTVTVDASRNYLDWARDNLELNHLWVAGTHRLVMDEVRDFLSAARRRGERFDLCLLDPPSYSDRTGNMGDLDVQRDHRALIEETLGVLSPGALLFFSTNHQRFEPDLEELPVTRCQEITVATVPDDFRNRQVHRAWRLIK
jgi:23S rRNA G2069 N7-methylase RlmK/C1962 C5-methylase RlmI